MNALDFNLVVNGCFIVTKMINSETVRLAQNVFEQTVH